MTILDRVGNVPEGLAYKAPCLVATTANIVLSGLQTIDGVSVPANARVLVKNQNDTTQNGIWQASTGNWTRPTDAGSNESWIYGTQVFIHSGTVNAGKVFFCSATADPIVIGTSQIAFTQLTVSGTPSSRAINTTAPLAGGGDLSADRTLTLRISAVLTVSGSALTIATNGVTYSLIQQVTAQRLLGNPTGSTANASEISLGTTLAFSGVQLQTGAGTGDVTWSANAFSTTIAANAVTAAKFRQSAGLSVVGTSGTGTANVGDITGTADQVLRVNSAGTLLGFGSLDLSKSGTVGASVLTIANGGTGASTLTNHGILLGQGTSAIAATTVMTDGQLLVGQSAADPLAKTLSGDATLTALGALTIANQAVTYAKIQNVSATARVLGRSSAGAGSTEELTASTVLDMIGTARGSVLRRGASGWEVIPPGTGGQVLTSNGAGADPTYQTVTGTGTVTNIATSFGLTGGPVTTSGTLSISTTAPPDGFDVPINLGLAASVGSSKLTIAIKDQSGADPTATSPVLIPFRSTSPTLGTVTWVAITSSLSIDTNAVGATLGSANSTAFRFWIVLFNNGGTAVLGLINCRGGGATPTQIFALNEGTTQSTTAMSGSATSAGVFYTPNGTTLTSKAFRIIGYLEYASGLATAGTYSAAPDFVTVFGPGMKKPGDVVQRVWSQTGAVSSGTTTVPADDTIPQNTEGDQYLSQAITPTASANLVEVETLFFAALSTAATIIYSFFQDSTANALATGWVTSDVGGSERPCSLRHQIVAATTSSTTFKVRAGPNIAATLTFNGASGSRDFGGVLASRLEVKEVMT